MEKARSKVSKETININVNYRAVVIHHHFIT